MSQESHTPKELERDIEATRQQLNQTIDAIQSRLSPQNLIAGARDSMMSATRDRIDQAGSVVQQTAHGASDVITGALVDTPVIGTLVGAALSIFAHTGKTGGTTMDPQAQRPIDTATQNAQQVASNAAAQAQQLAGQAQQFGSQVAGQAQQLGSQVADQAQQLGGQVADQAGQIAAQAQQVGGQVAAQAQQVGGQVAAQAQQGAQVVQRQVQGATGWLQHTVEENPLVIGALALAAGIAIGFAVPQTTSEHKLMGGTRDNLVQNVQSSVQDTVQKVQTVAQDAIHSAVQEAQRGASQAQTPPPPTTTA